MEGRFVVTALIFTLLAACSKQEIHQNSLQLTSPVPETEVNAGVYTSDWETVPSWTAEASTEAISFSYTRQLPQLKKNILNDGVVLVFARNLWAEDTALKEADDAPQKALMMPFYFLPYFEKPDYTERWNYSASENKVNVSLVVRGSKDAAAPGKKIQLRFMVIPGEKIREKKQTVQAIRKLSYDELVQVFKLTS